MAFTAKDGSKHTNIDSMKHSDARQMAATPNPAADLNGAPPDPGEGGAHDPQELEQLKQSFDSVMQAIATGQQPDQQTVQQLIQVFNSFITEEEHEGQEGREPEGY